MALEGPFRPSQWESKNGWKQGCQTHQISGAGEAWIPGAGVQRGGPVPDPEPRHLLHRWPRSHVPCLSPHRRLSPAHGQTQIPQPQRAALTHTPSLPDGAPRTAVIHLCREHPLSISSEVSRNSRNTQGSFWAMTGSRRGRGLSEPQPLASARGQRKAMLLLSKARSEFSPTRIRYRDSLRVPHPGQPGSISRAGGQAPPQTCSLGSQPPAHPSSLWLEGSHFPVRPSWPWLGGAGVSGGLWTEQSPRGPSDHRGGRPPSRQGLPCPPPTPERGDRLTFSGRTLPSTGQIRD